MSDKDLVERPEDGPEDDREQTLVAHLIELRSRIVRMAVSVLLVFACLSPFMKQIFDYLSKPLMVALPQGAKLLATGVIAPFMVPLKVTLFVAFCDCTALCAVAALGLHCSRTLSEREETGRSDHYFELGHVLPWNGILLFHRVPYGVSVHCRILSELRELRTGH